MHYCGIDLGSKSSSICIENQKGEIIREFEITTDEDSFRRHFAGEVAMFCVIEASPLAEWAAQILENQGCSVEVIDPRKAKAVICTKKKTDILDARNLAKMARTGWFTTVHRKSPESRMMRTLLKARTGLLETAIAQQSRIIGLLRAHGKRLPKKSGCRFEERLGLVMADLSPELQSVLSSLLNVWKLSTREAQGLTRRITELSRRHPVCRLLMSVPGVGPLVSACYVATIDDPGRFSCSTDVGSYLGLVPRVHQSGATEYRGRITKEGDDLVRWLLVEAAHVLLTRTKRRSALKAWGEHLREKKGLAKARVAVARKLAVLLHRIWVTGAPYSWTGK